MTEYICLFFYFSPKNGDFVSYGDNNNVIIIDSDTIGKFLDPMIRDIS